MIFDDLTVDPKKKLAYLENGGTLFIDTTECYIVAEGLPLFTYALNEAYTKEIISFYKRYVKFYFEGTCKPCKAVRIAHLMGGWDKLLDEIRRHYVS